MRPESCHLTTRTLSQQAGSIRRGCARPPRGHRRSLRNLPVGRLVPVLGALLLASCVAASGDEPTTGSSGDSSGALTARQGTSIDRAALDSIAQKPSAEVCGGGRFRCFAHIRTTDTGHIRTFAAAAAVQGYGPAELASAYKLDTSVDPVSTIAIIDAYGYANAESDLAQYRSNYGLPPCTTANGCLQIVNQQGQATPLPQAPPANDDWTVETALDLDMASAACPKCNLLLVQADDDRGDGLFIAQNAAVALGAAVISNSWGGPEAQDYPGAVYESYLNHPGVSIFVAAGDNGYNDAGQGPDYPGTSAYVIGVGGTSLVQAAGARGWAESAWTDGGSACSLQVAKPAWQTGTQCAYKASSDVSAVGDPNTGLAVYNANAGGWIVVGGTSASAPLVAGIYALTGHGADGPAYSYANTGSYFDVTSGTNGNCGTILCNAGAGWDGPTGTGTPNGTALATAGSGTDPGTGNGDGTGSGDGTGNGDGTGSGDGSGQGNGPGSGNPDTSGTPGTPVTGGCSAAGGQGAAGGLLGLGLALMLLAPRRRRRHG